MAFVTSQSQKHYLKKSSMIFSYKAFFLYCWEVPINILILLRIKTLKFCKLLHWYNTTLFQIASISSNFIGSVCNIMVTQKSQTALCCLLRDHASCHNPLFFIATIHIPSFLYCFSYFFSFCGFYPKSLQFMGKLPWPPRNLIH